MANNKRRLKVRGKSTTPAVQQPSVETTAPEKELPITQGAEEPQESEFDQEAREEELASLETETSSTKSSRKEKPSIDMTTVRQKAETAVKKSQVYDQEKAYVGPVTDIKDLKGGRKIFIVNGPHGPVQIYDTSLSVATRKQMALEATVQFTPVKNVGANREIYYTGVDVSVQEISKGAALYAKAVEAHAGTLALVPEADAVKVLSHATNYDQGMATLAGKYGDILGAVGKDFSGPGLVAWATGGSK